MRTGTVAFVGDKMVIYIDDETSIMDGPEKTVVGAIHEGDILHVTYMDGEGKSSYRRSLWG